MRAGLLSEIANGLFWEVRSRFRPLPIGDRPFVDEAGRAAVEAAIAGAEVYLEFGAGGSTIFAASHCRRVVSVESDRRIVDRVQKALGERKRHCRVIHADIGWTREKGHPVLTGGKHALRWREYPQAPWTALDYWQGVPDLVFIDGRFRVACILEAMLRLPAGWTGRFMLGDGSREAYRPIAPFIADEETHGRVAFFRRAPVLDRDACRAVLDRHYADPR